jgi:hypothetical protein
MGVIKQIKDEIRWKRDIGRLTRPCSFLKQTVIIDKHQALLKDRKGNLMQTAILFTIPYQEPSCDVEKMLWFSKYAIFSNGGYDIRIGFIMADTVDHLIEKQIIFSEKYMNEQYCEDRILYPYIPSKTDKEKVQEDIF